MPVEGPTVTVVICAFTEARWDDLAAAVASVAAQTLPVAETILVIDHHPGLEARARSAFPHVLVVPNEGPRGLSAGRNTAVAVATGDIVAFLDDDARADPKWIESIVRVFERPDAIAVGGRADAAWEGGRPIWFPPEFDWVVGCTHRGMPLDRAEVRNVIGCNMAFRRTPLQRSTGFSLSLGRIGSVPLGCEETELCIRLRRDHPGSVVVFEPAAVVDHHVTPDRRRFRYFLARNRAEGMSKSVVASLVGADEGMATERDYLRRVLVRAVGQGLREAVAGRPSGAARAMAIVLGLVAFGTGYVQAECRRRLVGPRRVSA